MRGGDRPAEAASPASADAPGPAPLRGREHELELIQGHLAGLTQGRAAVLQLLGAPGAGKTRLLAEAARLARRHGVRVLSAAGDPDEQLVPLAPLLHALTAGDPPVLGADGHRPAYDMAVGVVRAGGAISRVGVPQYEEAPVGFASLFGKNITLTGGPAPVRAYIEELLPEVLDGRLEPGRAFDRTVSLDDVPAGYRAMDERESIKVQVTP